LRDLFPYVYNLSPIEINILAVMRKNKKAVILDELSKEIDRDKINVFRSLQKLVSSGICSKETRASKHGGYYHLYNSIPLDKFKMETEERVKELEESIHRSMKKFENDLEMMVASYYRH
jgi:predicted transcriptional regulator